MDKGSSRYHLSGAALQHGSRRGLSKTIDLTIAAIEENRAGDLVECGTWKGGSTFAMLPAQRWRFGKILKPVWMFDSFQGLSRTGRPYGFRI
jgi:hypothetical protein